jgi:hypothetical protein
MDVINNLRLEEICCWMPLGYLKIKKDGREPPQEQKKLPWL